MFQTLRPIVGGSQSTEMGVCVICDLQLATYYHGVDTYRRWQRLESKQQQQLESDDRQQPMSTFFDLSVMQQRNAATVLARERDRM